MRTQLKVVLLAMMLAMSIVSVPRAEIVGTVATGLLIDKLRAEANELIEQATAKGDYLLARAGMEARIAIENFELANSRLLDKAFNNLDQASRENFARIQITLQQARDGAIDAAEAARQITESAEQIAVILDSNGHRSYVTRYQPSVAYEGKSGDFLLTVRGVNLDEADARLQIAPNVTLKPLTTGKQSLLFQVPKEALTFKPSESQLLKFSLQYSSVKPGFFNRIFGKKEMVTRDVALLAFPSQLATYKYSSTVNTSTRSTNSKDFIHEFQGKNVGHRLPLTPPAGWKIDVRSLQWLQANGEAGTCDQYDPAVMSPQGVVFQAHTGEVNAGFNKKAGWVKCRIIYTEYKDDPSVATGPAGSGTLAWTVDGAIPLPTDLNSMTIDVTTFDGITRTYADGGPGNYYDVVKEPTRFVLRPKLPTNISN